MAIFSSYVSLPEGKWWDFPAMFSWNQRDPSIDETPSFAAFALGETSQAHGPCDAMIELVEVEIETIWGYHG